MLVSAVMLVVLGGAIFFVGARYGSYLERQTMRSDFQVQFRGPAVARVEVDPDTRLDALAVKLGELQSQLLRLNVIGSRVVDELDLGRDEFDFTSLPGMGGADASPDAQSQTYDELLEQIGEFSIEIEKRSHQLQTLENLTMSRQVDEITIPAGEPVKSGWLTSTYGWRTDPFTGKRNFHSGVDYAASHGADVVAVASGLVIWAGRDGGYGNLVAIDHGDGFVTRYAHNKDLVVTTGDTVEKGQTIAHMGSTGHSTGTHVHFEVLLNNKKINPMKFIRRAPLIADKS